MEGGGVSGFLLIGVLLLWFWAVVAIARMLTSKLEPAWVKSLVTLLAIAVIIPLPVADDIIGGFQYRSLCSKEGLREDQFRIAAGKQLLEEDGSKSRTSGTLLTVTEQTVTYRSYPDNRELIRYKYFDSKGGWLSHLIGFPEGNPPYTFNGSWCGGPPLQELLNRYQIKILNLN